MNFSYLIFFYFFWHVNCYIVGSCIENIFFEKKKKIILSYQKIYIFAPN